jgi:hypothetical protein
MIEQPPALIWPQNLNLPPDNVILVYLDLNHWISLAQASIGHPKGTSFLETLRVCRRARLSGTAIFMLSAVHYMEMNKIKDPAQRRAIAGVMEELSGFASLVSRVVVMELELATVLDEFVRERIIRPSISLLGQGVLHCFGQRGGIKITGPAGDSTNAVREKIGPTSFDAFAASADLLLSRSVLRGPAEDEKDDLRTGGWRPEASIQIAETRAAQERSQKLILDREQRWRKSRLRDLVSARELIIEFPNMLARALSQRNLNLQDVFSDLQSSRNFVRAMPSTEVAIELKTAWHRNGSKNWTANDIYDLDALSLAVPYCDVVVTDKACHHALKIARLGDRMHTALLRKLEDLPDVLGAWEPKRSH